MSAEGPVAEQTTVEPAAVTATTKKVKAPRKAATTKKASPAKAKAAAKPKSAAPKAAKSVKSKAATSLSHPSWKDIVRECIVANKEDARQGVSRATIKKFAEEKYHLESTPANVYQLNRAITTGAETGVFSLPKGPSGKVKLAAKTKATSGAKENSKPPSKTAAKPASKSTTSKKPASKTVASKAAATKAVPAKKSAPVKKTLAGKPKAASTTPKKASTKKGSAKKAVTGATPAAKAKVAATKKTPAKKATVAKAATKAKTASKPRSKTASVKPGSKAKKRSMHNNSQSTPTHSYATRIRHNVPIKPALRLRYSPQPQQPSLPSDTWPQFPLPGIVLHPDDANSKVLLAIGRAFLSVDNRAMTIKDLSEMVVTFGLICQNMNATSQAITTYIRSHIQRCETQQDQPLLLRHILSGTVYDDDLLPALYSRSGGANTSAVPENRATNFRRGTVVWYLSRSTGAPCPFSRAGIRLCDYSEDGKKGCGNSVVKDRKKREREMHVQCGEKRKRSLRSCAAKDAASDADEGQPPPKVKLTLRLKPLQSRTGSPSSHTSAPFIDVANDSEESDSESSDDESMSVDSSLSEEDEALSPPQQPVEEETPWSLPPYPRKSISIPPYTPCVPNESYSCFPFSNAGSYRRSPSIPYSVGSPPPDSEDEDDDFHISMTGARRHSTAPRPPTEDTDGWDADLDSEGEGETWESPGPRSPSAPAMLPEVAVKEEPTDVQGMLEAWEDFDHSVAVADVIAKAAGGILETESASRVKLDNWSWDPSYVETSQDWTLGGSGDHLVHIKREDTDIESPFSLSSAFASSSPLTPLCQLPGLTYSDSPSPESPCDVSERSILPHKHRHTPFSYFQEALTSSSRVSSPHGNSKPELVIAPTLPSTTHSLAALIQSLSMNSPTAVAPSSLLIPSSSNPLKEVPGKLTAVVVHTCQPCTPAISATSIEGISVYQMMLGPFQLLRRIDTDFVNLSTIVAYSGGSWPVLSTITNAVVVNKGSVVVSGTWVPLSAAQAYVRDHHQNPLHQNPLHTFLSDKLYERFPPALQDFHRSSTQNRMLEHFGPHFSSTVQATQLCGSGPEPVSSLPISISSPSEPTSSSAFALSLSLATAASQEHNKNNFSGEQSSLAELPLSPSEQEMFHELCGVPEWDKENTPPSSPAAPEQRTPFVMQSQAQEDAKMTQAHGQIQDVRTMTETLGRQSERPLRRSKRVADAMATATQAQTHTSRTRSRRGGSRNSLPLRSRLQLLDFVSCQHTQIKLGNSCRDGYEYPNLQTHASSLPPNTSIRTSFHAPKTIRCHLKSPHVHLMIDHVCGLVRVMCL
ncbi:hypothetical protein H0H93_005394 [Arthromyces matolae]|nr:hypothetical protein H0H93_005394 [Arthromyces matolae]